MELVDASPNGCLLCGSTSGPGLWLAQMSFLCRSHVIELFSLVQAVPVFEHQRICDELQAQVSVLSGEAARADAAEQSARSLQTELDALKQATAHYGDERVALEASWSRREWPARGTNIPGASSA